MAKLYSDDQTITIVFLRNMNLFLNPILKIIYTYTHNAKLISNFNKTLNCFSKIFGGKSVLWGHWYQCFVLLVTSPLGFKSKVGSFICTWQRHVYKMFPEIHLWYYTYRPVGSQHGSRADLFHMPGNRHWWGSKPASIMPQVKTHTHWAIYMY